jgi:hypothetical protein
MKFVGDFYKTGFNFEKIGNSMLKNPIYSFLMAALVFVTAALFNYLRVCVVIMHAARKSTGGTLYKFRDTSSSFFGESRIPSIPIVKIISYLTGDVNK